MKKSIILLTLIFLVSIGFVMAQTVSFRAIPAGNVVDEICMKYDDFSGQNLSLNKWSESGTLDEHYLNSFEGAYHTKQNSPADRTAVMQVLNHNFSPGETFRYEMDYNFSSGNVGSFVSIDSATNNWLPIGYWSGCGGGSGPRACPAGNDTGTYNVKVDFYQGYYNVTIRNPNGTWIPMTGFPQIGGTTHTVGFGTRTGHNGIVHMDYDTVQICRKV
jgi:hypothetical protein